LRCSTRALVAGSFSFFFSLSFNQHKVSC
jgi:hypothetical protein